MLDFLWKVDHAQNHGSSHWPLPLTVRISSDDFHLKDKIVDSTTIYRCQLCARDWVEHIGIRKNKSNKLTLNW